MNSSTLVGNPNVMVAGPPPPPPPPPPVSGQLPAMRINTAENTTAKRPQIVNNDVYEPPAAIQNAMLTKDKKPFTYTPGMGGKLDLSQIRSPRMARRVAKNANDEGIEGPPKSAIESKQSPAVSPAANLLMPQVAVPVFPTNIPPQPHVNRMSQSPSVNRTLSNEKQAEPVRNLTKVDTKIPITITSNQSSTPTPESPSSPTQVTLVKAPTPWLQNKNKPQEELPEWAKRTNANKTADSDPPEDAVSPVYVQVQQSFPQGSQAKQKQEQKQYSISQNQQTRPQQPQPQPQQQRRNVESVTSQHTNPQSSHERVIPIRIEDRPSVFDAKRESGHHQFKQPPTLHHQQRWGQMPAQHTLENQAQNHPQNQRQSQIHVTTPSRPEQPAGTTYIIPLVVEGSEKRTIPSNKENNIKIGKSARIVQQRNPELQQHEPGPVQSRSFRVLQKITDTDECNDVGPEQIRKMELSEDEKILMNKFKEQVDHETYLHQEKDPRYRGAAIPSRAFRFLQNMTESNDSPVCAAPDNVQNVANKRQNRNSKSFEETQANLPPSEQQVPEPKKYTGSAIPSRSFRILQAMTASENDATQENRQADYTCRTENNLPGNQQDAFFSPRPVPFWSHSEGWWGYYPVPYNAPSNKPANEADERSFPYLRYPDENACVGYEFFYPVYDESYADAARMNVTENSSDQCGYVAVICPRPGRNVVPSDTEMNNCKRIDNRCLDTTIHSSPVQNDRHSLQNASVDESRNALPDEINHLDAESSETYSPRNICESYNSDRNCLMNIVDEEDDASDRLNETIISNNIEKSKKTFGLHINVPNYTYVDTSDSSDSSECSDTNDSSDSSDSISDNEHFSNSCRNDTTSNNTSSSDSDSYEGYSVDLNPYEKSKRNPRAVSSAENRDDSAAHSGCSINVDNLCRHSRNNSENSGDRTLPEKNHTDYSNDQNSCIMKQDLAMCIAPKGRNEKSHTDNFDSCETSSETNSVGDNISNVEQRDQENPITDDVVPHHLGTVHEDAEQSSSETKKKLDGRNETSLEIDDPSDDDETTMVSVSLPLKFRFSVSEDNEDITTVTVGNSEIKAERSRGGYSARDDENDDVCVDFHIGNDTSVDFTVKRHTSDTTCATTSTRDKVSIETAVPHVDFTLKKDLTNVSEANCEEQNAETEFPVTKTIECHKINSKESASSKDADDRSIDSESTAARDVSVKDENRIQAESACNNFERDVNGTTECSWTSNFETLQVPIVDTNQTNCSANNNDDRCADPEFYQPDAKDLLSVRDSREDTDDEDSGVTSDTSRMISEVDAECREIDTDSECAVSKNRKKYQRTQTHSRLFRLLNDDANLSECTSVDPGSRKEYLSLPLKTNNAFNYDDSYCSNYSSGLTSPEYSPIHEQSCRKFHDAATGGNGAGLPDVKFHPAQQPEHQISSKDNSYFSSWRSTKLPNPHEQDVVPSLAFKILNSKVPLWTYKVNVLCPRIKSTKSVPQALLARQIDKH